MSATVRKKDFVAIAEIIKQAAPAEGRSCAWCEECRKFIAIQAANYFAAENRKFDRARFLKACGVDSAVIE